MARFKLVYDNYEVYDNGIIYSRKSKKILSQFIRKDCNQYFVTLFHNGKVISASVARLVAEAFLEKPDTDEPLIVGHINLDTKDNSADNLIWLTKKSFINRQNKLGAYDKLREKHRKKIKLINRLECTEVEFKSMADAAMYLKSVKQTRASINTIKTALSTALKRGGTVYNWSVVVIEKDK